MPRTTKTPLRGEHTLAALKARGIRPQDIDEDWLDDMVKRLFTELRRQLTHIEGDGDCEKATNASERAANARTLASLERTLERLAKLEGQRVEKREKKGTSKHADACDALERKIDRIVAASSAKEGSGTSVG